MQCMKEKLITTCDMGRGIYKSVHYEYNGEWESDKKDGKGDLTILKSGFNFKGIWKHDIPQEKANKMIFWIYNKEQPEEP